MTRTARTTTSLALAVSIIVATFAHALVRTESAQAVQTRVACGAGYSVRLGYGVDEGSVVMRYNPSNRTVCMGLNKVTSQQPKDIGVKLRQGSTIVAKHGLRDFYVGPIYMRLPKGDCRWSYSHWHHGAWHVDGSTGCDFYTG